MEELWNAYFHRLRAFAQSRVPDGRCDFDGDDIAVSVFDSLNDRAKRGKLKPDLLKDSLWGLLLKITHKKVVERIRYSTREKRDARRVEHGVVPDVFQYVSEEDLVDLNEQLEVFMDRLSDETMRQIVRLKLGGYTINEIAKQLGFSDRSIGRKLKIIRDHWRTFL
ncbi:MAG: ECF-type sigma factor [Aureliella sp.]